MSHVDEGALHAYLDGALDEYPAAEARRVREHVETCAVCAERLAEERRVREEARAILDLAAPEVEVPTFEELRAYVRASRPARTAVSVRLYRLGWAASVVLALGTGWLLRGGAPAPAVRLDAIGGAEGPAQPAESADVERAAEFGMSDAPARSAAEEREADAQVAAGLDTPATDVAVTAQAPATAPAPSGVVAERRADGAVGDVVGRVEPLRPPVPQVQAAQAPTDLVADARLADDVGAGVAAAVAPAAAPVAEQRQADGQRRAERLDSAARANEAARRSAPEQVLTSANAVEPAAPPALRARATDEALRDQEAESLVIPGLEVLDVLPVGQGSTFAGMRALQRLAGGDTLELIHLPEGIDPSFLATRRADQNELVRQRGAGWLVMRAPVSVSYLEELLQRLEAGR